MRAVDTGQARRLRSRRRVTVVRVEIQDDTGTYQDWTDVFGRDLIQSVDWGEELDSPGLSANVSFYWRSYYDNASPYMTGSRLEDWLAAGRGVRIYTEVLPDGDAVAGGDEQHMFDGVIDGFDIQSNPGTLRVRDLIIANLMDEWVEADAFYGAGDPPMETYIQSIITGNATVPVTLYTPTTPGFAMANPPTQPQNIHSAIKAVWLLIGWDCRSKWRASSSQFELTLYDPNRTKTTPDDTIEKELYRAIPAFGLGREDVRNVIDVYYDSGSTGSGGERNLQKITVSDAPSIAKYGRRWMQVVEGVTGGISVVGEATTFANRILSDLKDPVAEVTITLPYWWPVQLNDLFRLEADGERFGADTDLAVIGYSHRIDANDATTELRLAGRPRSGTRTWLEREARPGQATPRDTASPAVPTVTINENALSIDFLLDWSGANDWDVVEVHEGNSAVFTPSLATLVDQSRTTRAARRKGKGSKFYKLAVRDKTGNRSTFSVAAAASPTGVKKLHLADELLHAVKIVPTSDRTPSPSPVILEFDDDEWGITSMFDDGNDLIEVDFVGVYEITAIVVPSGSQDLTSWRVKIIKDPGGTPVTLADSGTLTNTDERVFLSETVLLLEGDQMSVETTYLGSMLGIAAAGTSFTVKPTTIQT